MVSHDPNNYCVFRPVNTRELRDIIDHFSLTRLAPVTFGTLLGARRDFNAPGNPATADTSSGAIAASALTNLAAIERSLGNVTGSDYYVKSAVNVRSAARFPQQSAIFFRTDYSLFTAYNYLGSRYLSPWTQQCI